MTLTIIQIIYMGMNFTPMRLVYKKGHTFVLL